MKITLDTLIGIGFKKKEYEFKDPYGEDQKKTYYEIQGKVNDSIYYNPEEKVYKFYYKTMLGEVTNHVLLDIDTRPALFSVLQAFGFDFKLILK